MNQPIDTTHRTTKPSKNILWKILKWVLILAITGVVLYFASTPVRSYLSDNYRQSGDRFLLSKKYLSAGLEYRKALILYPNNSQARVNRELAKEASANVLKLENFSRENSESHALAYDLAAEVPASEDEAVATSKRLIEAGEYQLALISAKTAIEMDKNYRDAWLYLAIANLKCAQLLETSNDNKEVYKKAAKEALEQVAQIDPANQLAAKILNTM